MYILNESQIQKFWAWFQSVSVQLYNDCVNKRVIENLDANIKKLGLFDWEIGPYNTKLYLAISPNLNPQLLDNTKQIIAYAPKSEDWVFLSSKPPKNYYPILNLVNEFGNSISINIDSWRYILYHFDNDTFDMDVVTEEIHGNVSTKKLAIDIVLTNILGEEKYISLIKNIYTLDCFDESNNSSEFKFLNEHINKILYPLRR